MHEHGGAEGMSADTMPYKIARAHVRRPLGREAGARRASHADQRLAGHAARHQDPLRERAPASVRGVVAAARRDDGQRRCSRARRRIGRSASVSRAWTRSRRARGSRCTRTMIRARERVQQHERQEPHSDGGHVPVRRGHGIPAAVRGSDWFGALQRVPRCVLQTESDPLTLIDGLPRKRRRSVTGERPLSIGVIVVPTADWRRHREHIVAHSA